MSMDRRYIVNFQMQGLSSNRLYNEIETLRKHDNIAVVKEICTMSFYVQCRKWGEDDLIRKLYADQVLYSDDGDNYFQELV